MGIVKLKFFLFLLNFRGLGLDQKWVSPQFLPPLSGFLGFHYFFSGILGQKCQKIKKVTYLTVSGRSYSPLFPKSPLLIAVSNKTVYPPSLFFSEWVSSSPFTSITQLSLPPFLPYK